MYMGSRQVESSYVEMSLVLQAGGDTNNTDTKVGSCHSFFTSGFPPYNSLPHQPLLPSFFLEALLTATTTTASLTTTSCYLGQGLKQLLLQQLLFYYFYSWQGLKQNTLFSSRLTSSSATPPHLIRIHTRFRHELRSFTDRLTSPDHKEQSSLAGSPRMLGQGSKQVGFMGPAAAAASHTCL